LGNHKLRSLIRYLLQHAPGGRLNRTQLVKLVFLTDYEHYETFGCTVTGLGYEFAEQGPFTWDIVDETKIMEDVEHRYHDPSFLRRHGEYEYRLTAESDEADTLTVEERATACLIMRQHGRETAGALVHMLHEDAFVRECGEGNPIDFSLLDGNPLADGRVEEAVLDDSELYESMRRGERELREGACRE